MKLNYQLKNKNFFIVILIIATLLILPKWVLSYTFFDENIILRIIHDASDAAYFPIINSYSDLNFSNSYSEIITDLKLISFPIIGLIINSFFFKILGGFSFIFLELVCTVIFLWLFYNLFLELNFSYLLSLALTIFLFILPSILRDLRVLNIDPLTLLSYNFEYFFTTRFPRPAINHLFFFAFVFFTIRFYKDNKDSIKNTFIITILIGLTVNTFFYLFFIEFFLLIIILYLKLKNDLFKFLLNNLKHFFYCLLILIFFLSVFQIQIFLAEPDYVKRMGVFTINFEQKKILFDYLFSFIFGVKFLFLFSLNTIFLFLSKNKYVNYFYYLFIASILTPIFSFAVLNKGVDYYHFFNWIVISGFLFPLISILHYVETRFSKNIKFYHYKSLMFLMIFSSLFYSNLNHYFDFKFKSNNEYSKRHELSEVTNFISQNQSLLNKNLEILTLNYELSIWFLLNDYNNFSIVPLSFWTPKTDDMIETELISSMKFLGLDNKNFNNLIKNKSELSQAEVMKNKFVYGYFGRKYLANSLVVFSNDNSDFNNVEKNFIKSNNLLMSHQIIIPKSEINRLLNKFDNNKRIINPDIVIIDNESYQKIDKFENNNFCLIFKNNKYKIFSNKILNLNCL